MKLVIDIDENDYIIIKNDADFFIYGNNLYDQLASRAFHSVKNGTLQTTDNVYKDLCEYKNILGKTVNSLNNIKQGDFLYGKWLAYSDCLAMITGIITKYKEVE